MSLSGFENVTKLSKIVRENKNKIITLIIDILYVRIGKRNAVTSNVMIDKIRTELNISIAPAQFRAVMHHIRTQNIMKLILSGSKGYWRAKTKQEIMDCIQSLKEREEQIRELRLAIQNQYQNRLKEKKIQ